MSNDIARSFASAVPAQNTQARSQAAADRRPAAPPEATPGRLGPGPERADDELATGSTRQPKTEAPQSEDNAPREPELRERLEEAAERLAERSGSLGRDLRFEVGDDGTTPVIKVIDPKTDEVVRQIPSEEAMARANAIAGRDFNLIDETA